MYHIVSPTFSVRVSRFGVSRSVSSSLSLSSSYVLDSLRPTGHVRVIMRQENV